MNVADYIHRRRGRYLARTMEAFETEVEPHLSPEGLEAARRFKGTARQNFAALAHDAVESIGLRDEAINGAAQDIRDRIHAPRT